ncbi:methyltransferase domain-containing protein [Streptomyces sp. NPDC002055]|uniref:methyltransferase domain-containing protein n=1 Tax=Streptomyces sp. NPDC002055 TaxID=3154534 RepID=UPI0033267A6C
METLSEKEQAAMSGLLRAVSADLGTAVSPEWESAYYAVPRHRFLPDLVWLESGRGYVRCDREREPERWLTAAYADAPVVTQVNDGLPPECDDEAWPSSSASAPSIVFRMLHMLELRIGMRVLEVGTGTGWNAGLLAARLGSEHVTSVDVDLGLATTAAHTLDSAAGLRPRIVARDGTEGFAPSAPYDRVIATCAVRTVPYPWVTQTRPGGVILTPWETPWLCYGLLRLDVGGDGTASGRFSPHSAFMLMREQRTDLRIFRDVVRDEHSPRESVTGLSPWTVTGDDWALGFAVGLRLSDVWHAWQDEPDVEGVRSRLWLATTDARSWAAVDWDGRRSDRFTVWQYGPRRLWDEAETAYRWWRDAGEPGPGRFGLTVTPDGQLPWLDSPDRPLRSAWRSTPGP